MIEEKLFKYLRDYKNFNDFKNVYIRNNFNIRFSYDVLFRDHVNDSYEDSEEYVAWHNWLLIIIGKEGYELLLEQLQ